MTEARLNDRESRRRWGEPLRIAYISLVPNAARHGPCDYGNSVVPGLRSPAYRDAIASGFAACFVDERVGRKSMLPRHARGTPFRDLDALHQESYRFRTSSCRRIITPLNGRAQPFDGPLDGQSHLVHSHLFLHWRALVRRIHREVRTICGTRSGRFRPSIMSA